MVVVDPTVKDFSADAGECRHVSSLEFLCRQGRPVSTAESCPVESKQIHLDLLCLSLIEDVLRRSLTLEDTVVEVRTLLRL